MHHHTEIVIPAGCSVEEAVQSIMAPFDENREGEDGERDHTFWDFYEIGGRWSGAKAMQLRDPAKLQAFDHWCVAEKITVCAVTCGKRELDPASQIQKVDAKWNELFPRADGRREACPIFRHSERDGASLSGDVLELGQCKLVKCDRVIFAGPSWQGASKALDGPLRAVFMLCESVWNGCNHMPIAWDGTVGAALSQHLQKLERCGPEYKKAMLPGDDWLCVTVDYHS